MNNIALANTPTNIRARQINDADVTEVVNLITRGFGAARPREFWEHIFTCLRERQAPAGFPRYGYVIESDTKLVGVLILIFSTIREGGNVKIRCNVSSWYVDPAFRSYAPLLAMQALKHKNVTVLNISPVPHTRAMIEATHFTRYNQGIFAAIPTLSRAPKDSSVRVINAQIEPDAPFDPDERKLLLEHAGYGCTSLWCVTPERAYPFVFRPRTVKNVLRCAQLIYCPNNDDFVRFSRPIGLYLARSLQLIVILDANGPIPGLVGIYCHDRMPKYFLGPDRPRLGDLAYTETSMFGV